jgi:flagellin
MGLSITNNVNSLTAQHNLSRTNSTLSKSLERLSSGLKVNRGADGPAALVISEQQRAQISGLQQALDNTNKAVSLVQTGEGSLNEINGLLTKVRGLALDSANAGVNDQNALAANQAEIANALSTIDRIAGTTQFGSRKLLDGSSGVSGTSSTGDLEFVKAEDGVAPGEYAVRITKAAEKGVVTAAAEQQENLTQDETLTINNVDVGLNAGMSQDQVIARINEFTGQTGVIAEKDDNGSARLVTSGYGSGFKLSVSSNVAADKGSSGFGTETRTATGADVVGSIGDGSEVTGKGQMLTAADGDAKGITVQITGVDSADPLKTVSGDVGAVKIEDKALIFQIGSNSSQTISIGFGKISTDTLGIGVENRDNRFSSLAEIDVTQTNGAADALQVIDQAMQDVSQERQKLGAFQSNTLESNANNLRSTLENTTAAESVIRDTDFASEMASFTKAQVMMQAGQTVLGNANQIPQMVAALLRG